MESRGLNGPSILALFLILAGGWACRNFQEVNAAQAPPHVRLVVVGPSTLENMDHLGILNSVVGVSNFCRLDAADGLPRVGGLIDPNLERIAQLRPNCVFVQGKSPLLKVWSQTWGVELVEFSTDSVAEWEEEITFLQGRFGLPVEPLPLEWPVPVAGEPRVLLVVGRDPGTPRGVLAAGPSSFLSEMLEKAGGKNVLSGEAKLMSEGRAYFQVDPETLLMLDPAVIFDLAATPGRGPLEEWRRAYPGVAAVKAGRVRALRHPDALLPGPRMGEVAALMAEVLRESRAERP
jgi:iron complex transport system substrate-binding protein